MPFYSSYPRQNKQYETWNYIAHGRIKLSSKNMAPLNRFHVIYSINGLWDKVKTTIRKRTVSIISFLRNRKEQVYFKIYDLSIYKSGIIIIIIIIITIFHQRRSAQSSPHVITPTFWNMEREVAKVGQHLGLLDFLNVSTAV